MMVALGENGIKTVEDFADCATDELVGWTERKKEKYPQPPQGHSRRLRVSRTDVENMITAARVHAGWIKGRKILQKPAEVEGEPPEAASEDAVLRGWRVMFGEADKARDGGAARSAGDGWGGDASGPERQRAVTRQSLDPSKLIRFVLSPEGTVVPPQGAEFGIAA